MKASYRISNVLKGLVLEEATRDVLSSEFKVDSHKVTDLGVDVKAVNDSRFIVAECLNWYGGYIHPKRFLSIIRNLRGYTNAELYLICAGVRPTKEQYQILKSSNIKVVCLPRQSVSVDFRDLLINALDLGVITNLSSRGIHTSNKFLIDILAHRKVFPESFFRSRYKSWIVEAAFTVKKKGNSLNIDPSKVAEWNRRKEVRRLIKLHKAELNRSKIQSKS